MFDNDGFTDELASVKTPIISTENKIDAHEKFHRDFRGMYKREPHRLGVVEEGSALALEDPKGAMRIEHFFAKHVSFS